MDSNLVNLLKQTGFTQKEAQVYLSLLELGRGDVAEIAKMAGLKRTIVYVIVDELIEKGYATKLPSCKINTYQAIDPGVVLTQVKNVVKNLVEMVPYMRSLQNKSGISPKIHYADTKESILKVYDEMNEHDKQFFISSYVRIEDVFPGLISEWLWKYKKGIFNNNVARHLVPDQPGEMDYARKFSEIGQKVRVSKNLTNMKMDFTVFGDNLAITSLEDRPFVVIFKSQSLVDSIMPIFEIVWRSGKEF